MCIVDSKALFWSVLHFSANAADSHDKCAGAGDKSQACSDAILATLDSVANMGGFIAGVLGHCTKPADQKAKCAADVLGLLRDLTSLGKAGSDMEQVCGLDHAERLYLQESRTKNIQSEASVKESLPSLALVMMLPITAVLSFIAGRRMAKTRQISVQDAEAVECPLTQAE